MLISVLLLLMVALNIGSLAKRAAKSFGFSGLFLCPECVENEPFWRGGDRTEAAGPPGGGPLGG